MYRPLTESGCPLELRAFGAILARKEEYYEQGPGQTYTNMGTFAADLSLERAFGQYGAAVWWSNRTKQEWQLSARIKANAQIRC